eukprot:TRINITY_DN211_c0_g1_i2.p1 TRINITY_DN211_c0_g1~~TRINITY_DN211_c0_g1_i2.p1  ORF type:complete len:492 (+),score=121.63 TRINITY_DN211_c0_g1_i2:77-1552(+)
MAATSENTNIGSVEVVNGRVHVWYSRSLQLEHIVQGCKLVNEPEIVFHQFPALTVDSIAAIAANVPNLAGLRFYQVKGLDLCHLVKIVAEIPSFKALSLMDGMVELMTPAFFEALPQIKQLEQLRMDMVYQFEQYIGVFTTFPKLTALRVDNCGFSTEQTGELLNAVWLKVLPQLQRIHWTFSSMGRGGSDHSILPFDAAFSTPLPNLRALHVDGLGFRAINARHVDLLLKNAPDLETFVGDVDNFCQEPVLARLHEFKNLKKVGILRHTNILLANYHLHIAALNQITTLYYNASITPAIMAGLHNLRHFYFRGEMFRPESVSTICQFLDAHPLLETVHINSASGGVRELKPICNTKLRSIKFGGMPMNDAWFAMLCAQNPDLEEVELSRASLHDAGVLELNKLPRLRKLHVTHVECSDETLLSVLRPGLREVEVWGSRGVEFVVECVKRLPDVVVLSSLIDNGCADAVLEQVIKSCPMIRTLSLRLGLGK